ncbi:MAG: hypothetical protein M1812_001711 [Candelaria pacifica]|nr:MAG: hypothetical protein M1812_001711 [Candelaria pacifica]
MEDAAPPPIVPVRSSAQAQVYHRRRSSLPPPSSHIPKLRSANHVRLKPASPEVMASLISSISTISSPASSPFEGFSSIGSSYSTPTSPSSHTTTFPNVRSGAYERNSKRSSNASSRGFGMEYGAYTHPNNSRDQDLLHPDDAADPPVVRTSRPPSGFSPHTAPPTSSLEFSNPLKKFVQSGSRSAGSKSRRESVDSSNTGQLSCDWSNSVDPTTSKPVAINELRNSAHTTEGSTYTPLRDRVLGSAKEMINPENMPSPERGLGFELGFEGPTEGLKGERDRSHVFSEPLFATTLIDEELIVSQQSTSTPKKSSANTSPERHDQGSSVGTSHANIETFAGGDLVPHRDSSMHKTGGLAVRKRLTLRSSSQPSPVGEEKIQHEDQYHVTDDPYDLTVEGDVAKRIKELREQKLKRDRPTALEPSGLSLRRSPFSSPEVSSVLSQEVTSSLNRPASVEAPHVSDTEGTHLSEDTNAGSIGDSRKKGRGDGIARVSSLTGKPSQSPFATFSKDATPSKELSQPQRSNSFLRRLSPSASASTDPHRRTMSYGVSKTQENTSSSRPSLAGNETRPSSADPTGDAVRAYLSSPHLSQKIPHPTTGRIISFSEVGDPNGFAVFCCVGMGLTRYITAFYDELARTLKLRLITPDRPGIGESEPYPDETATPLGWPDDIHAICQVLKITKFSLLAHSAGAIYALATALRMPQHIRGRVHLLAPWIPPSQMSTFGSQKGSAPTGAVPTSQRILRALPTPFLRAINSSFMSATSASINSSLPKSPRRNKRNVSNTSSGRETPTHSGRDAPAPANLRDPLLRDHSCVFSCNGEAKSPSTAAATHPATPQSAETKFYAAMTTNILEKERQTLYDKRLTHAIWDLATTSANPAVDLLVCLERRQAIGFRYVDITRSVVIHHGSKDSRVPVDNVKWLGKTMRRCEVRILEGEGHGLMASATVMGSILMEMAKEWEDWTRVTQGKAEGRKKTSDARTSERGV